MDLIKEKWDQILLNVMQEQIVVKDGRFIIVEKLAFFKGEVGMIEVVSVLLQNKAALTQPLLKRLGQGRLSASAGAADPDKEHMHYPFSQA